MPQFDKIIAAYVVPVENGPMGYVTKHGQRVELI